jgi:hypothetical protein
MAGISLIMIRSQREVDPKSLGDKLEKMKDATRDQGVDIVSRVLSQDTVCGSISAAWSHTRKRDSEKVCFQSHSEP